MAVRRVRLDEDSERILAGLARDMGLSVSAVLKQGLLALRNQRMSGCLNAYEIYQELDLGPGGYALAPSTETRRGVEQALRTRPLNPGFSTL
jgi:hypothetical protein